MEQGLSQFYLHKTSPLFSDVAQHSKTITTQRKLKANWAAIEEHNHHQNTKTKRKVSNYIADDHKARITTRKHPHQNIRLGTDSSTTHLG